MIDVEAAKRASRRLLARARGFDLQVTVLGEDGNVTRFAGSEIHQNISQRDATVVLRAHRQGAIAETTVHGTDPSAHDRALERVVSLLDHARPIPGLAEGLPAGGPAIEASFVAPGAVRTRLSDKARSVGLLHRIAAGAGAQAWGAYVTGRTLLSVESTRGVSATLEASDATIETLFAAGEQSGYASATGLDPERLQVEDVGSEAAGLVARRARTEGLEPGEYEVVLGPHAVAELLGQLAHYGANGLVHNDRLSFLQGCEGRRVFSEHLTVRDDGHDAARSLPLPFDLEGVRREAATLVDRGVFAGAVHDRISALRAGAPPCALGRSTAGMFSFFGSPPLPLNLQLAPGSAPVEELVRGVRRGVWITRLWYVRMQDDILGVSTGLTRDGTFWIEGGELARPLRSARYTQALGELLGRVTAVASHGLLHAPTTWFEPRLRTGTWAPAIRVAGMRFTS